MMTILENILVVKCFSFLFRLLLLHSHFLILLLFKFLLLLLLLLLLRLHPSFAAEIATAHGSSKHSSSKSNGRVAAAKLRRPCTCHLKNKKGVTIAATAAGTAAAAGNAAGSPTSGGAIAPPETTLNPLGADFWCMECAPAENSDEEGITMASMQSLWLPSLVGPRSATRATLLVCGNCSELEVDALGASVHRTLSSTSAAIGCAPIPYGGLPQQPVRKLKAGEVVTVEVGSEDPEQKNSACEMYWSCGEDSLTTRVRVFVVSCC